MNAYISYMESNHEKKWGRQKKFGETKNCGQFNCLVQYCLFSEDLIMRFMDTYQVALAKQRVDEYTYSQFIQQAGAQQPMYVSCYCISL